MRLLLQHRPVAGESPKYVQLILQQDLLGGWLLLRAWNEDADPLVLDLYPYATTNPVWLGTPTPTASAPEDAAYFSAWLARVIEAASARDDYNDEAERKATLDYLREAQSRYDTIAKSSSAHPRERNK